MVYLNCAATARDRPACVREAVVHALDEFGSCGRGTHASELDAARSIGAARCSLAELLGCEQTERVVFAANAPEALNMANLGTPPPRGRVAATRPRTRAERDGGGAGRHGCGGRQESAEAPRGLSERGGRAGRIQGRVSARSPWTRPAGGQCRGIGRSGGAGPVAGAGSCLAGSGYPAR